MRFQRQLFIILLLFLPQLAFLFLFLLQLLLRVLLRFFLLFLFLL